MPITTSTTRACDCDCVVLQPFEWKTEQGRGGAGGAVGTAACWYGPRLQSRASCGFETPIPLIRDLITVRALAGWASSRQSRAGAGGSGRGFLEQ